MTKTQLRTRYRKRRKELSAEVISSMSLKIANNLLDLPLWDGNRYHLFLPIVDHHEVDTMPILTSLQAKDKDVVLSKCNLSNATMQHFLLTDQTKLSTNVYGITEPIGGISIDPKEIDVVFVPLLAYDKKGNRVGYGKGFYDRFLAQCRADTHKVGLSFFDPEQRIDASPTDVALNYVVCPNSVYTF